MKMEGEEATTDDQIATIPTTYAVFESPNEIHYTPEEFLKEGVKMVKNIKSHVKRLELGSKLRKEVWLGEIARCDSCNPLD